MRVLSAVKRAGIAGGGLPTPTFPSIIIRYEEKKPGDDVKGNKYTL